MFQQPINQTTSEQAKKSSASTDKANYKLGSFLMLNLGSATMVEFSPVFLEYNVDVSVKIRIDLEPMQFDRAS